MAFSGSCLIRRVGMNSGDGRVHIDLKSVDGTSFDWNWFLAKQEHNREILAVALAAITSNKTVFMQTNETTPWAEVWWFDIEK